MTPKISLLHATFKRPEKALATMRHWLQMAFLTGKIEYILAVNEDDETAHAGNGLLHEARLIAATYGATVNAVMGFFKGSAPAWSEAAKHATGDLLIQVSDDFEPPAGWDMLLYTELEIAAPLTDPKGCWEHRPIFVLVSDGHREGHLATMLVVTRKYYELDGYFLWPGFASVYSDDHASYRALKRREDGSAIYVEAKHIVFNHRHHYHDPSVPMDEVYSRQNSAENYASGAEQFAALNPDADGSPLLDWRK